jgi:hypothetical protein
MKQWGVEFGPANDIGFLVHDEEIEMPNTFGVTLWEGITHTVNIFADIEADAYDINPEGM